MQEKPRILLQSTQVCNANRVEPHLSKEQGAMTRTKFQDKPYLVWNIHLLTFVEQSDRHVRGEMKTASFNQESEPGWLLFDYIPIFRKLVAQEWNPWVNSIASFAGI